MMAAAPKKLLILAILEILRKYTDVDHPMLQADIIARLNSDYELTSTRKSVRTNITELIAAGYPLIYQHGWYYDHDFCTAELNLLTDSLLFNPNIPYTQCRELIEKIKGLGGVWYKPIVGQSLSQPVNPQFLYTFDSLHEAISEKKRVSFLYGDYGTDKQLHPRKFEDGGLKLYDCNPYRIILSNGRYYLIGNVNKYDNVAHFRVDRIMELKLTNLPAKEARDVHGLESGLNIPEYIASHPHMFSGDIQTIRLQINRSIIGETLDWFGMNIEFSNEAENTVDVVVRTDENSLYYWLKMYDAFARRI